MLNTKDKADKIIQTHMMFAMGAGLVPIPMVDVVAVTAVQVDMLKQLAKHYNIDFDEQSGKSWILSIGGSVLARMGASTVKAIPVIGSLLGGVTMSALSGASTYAIGNVFKEHFKAGGDLSNVDLDKAKRFFKEKFEEGKKMAKDMDGKMDEKMDEMQNKFEETVEDIQDKFEDTVEDMRDTDNNVQDAEIVDKSKVKSPMEQLATIAQMRDDGLLTDEEFETMKKKIIDASAGFGR